MNDLFLNTFLSVFKGIIKIFIIGGIAGLLVWRKVILQSFIDGLSKITVYVFLPCLIFSTIISGFNPQQERYWWIIPIAVIIVSLAGMGIASLMFIPDFKLHRNVLPLSSMQNAAYLVLPIGEFIYHVVEHDHVGPGGQGFTDLQEVGRFDLDADAGADP